MAISWKILAVLILLSSVQARPGGELNNVSQLQQRQLELSGDDESEASNEPGLYLIIAEAPRDDDVDEAASLLSGDEELEKRSAEEPEDDLETAAGTNVLRPLFVYRQQLAYRERVKKGVRRSGIRPRF